MDRSLSPASLSAFQRLCPIGFLFGGADSPAPPSNNFHRQKCFWGKERTTLAKARSSWSSVTGFPLHLFTFHFLGTQSSLPWNWSEAGGPTSLLKKLKSKSPQELKRTAFYAYGKSGDLLSFKKHLMLAFTKFWAQSWVTWTRHAQHHSRRRSSFSDGEARQQLSAPSSNCNGLAMSQCPERTACAGGPPQSWRPGGAQAKPTHPATLLRLSTNIRYGSMKTSFEFGLYTLKSSLLKTNSFNMVVLTDICNSSLLEAQEGGLPSILRPVWAIKP